MYNTIIKKTLRAQKLNAKRQKGEIYAAEFNKNGKNIHGKNKKTIRPQFLHNSAYRPRKIHSCRQADGNDRAGKQARYGKSTARFYGFGTRARHYH